VEPSETRHRGQMDEYMLQADHQLEAKRILCLPPCSQDSHAPTPPVISLEEQPNRRGKPAHTTCQHRCGQGHNQIFTVAWLAGPIWPRSGACIPDRMCRPDRTPSKHDASMARPRLLDATQSKILRHRSRRPYRPIPSPSAPLCPM
jgi:hypothetical protein